MGLAPPKNHYSPSPYPGLQHLVMLSKQLFAKLNLILIDVNELNLNLSTHTI